MVSAVAAAAAAYIRRRYKHAKTQDDFPDAADIKAALETYRINAAQMLEEVEGDNIRLTQKIACDDEDLFFELVKSLRDDGYALDDIARRSAVIGVVLPRDLDMITSTIADVYERVMQAGGTYDSFAMEAAQ